MGPVLVFLEYRTAPPAAYSSKRKYHVQHGEYRHEEKVTSFTQTVGSDHPILGVCHVRDQIGGGD